MARNRLNRRTVLKNGAGIAGLSVLGGSATASEANTESGRISGPDYGGSAVGFEITDVDGGGTLIENVSVYETPMLADLHTVVWDEGWELVKNTRDDAFRHYVSTDDGAPGGTAIVTFEYVNPYEAIVKYWPVLTQRAIASAARPALLVEQELELGSYSPIRYGGSPGLRHTIYTIANPTIGTEATSGVVTEKRGYDAFVASTDAYSVAIVQRCVEPDVRTGFDGHRVGDVGVAQGTDRSAWVDIYEEADGWIDRNFANEGDIDFGAGLYVGGDQDAGAITPVPTWRTGIGFATSNGVAIDNAIATVEDGYETERNRY
ncbi:hypothetical protein [Natrinema caseinilyticum]|uniref:hypothetical protein n=1 Tax=Natrinema caseinilyticum TaxID=2961570 RepID=UPI0020C30B57|nr:hypothetical protein [Natrinema caseinilyticum]